MVTASVRAFQAPSSLEPLLAAKEIVICCGSGGVGKTTTAAAAAAMAAAHLGGKVLVITVDPARRLAHALGLERFGNVETQVPPKLFAAAGVEPRGELWAAMLDTKQSWDELVRAHAPDAATSDAILANPLYDNITSRFVQSHDYIAMERLYEIHASGRYDLIIVDTPPTRNAIDFLEAPERMADFFSSRLLRWLTVPARSRVFTVASKPFYTVADRILGSQFLQDIAEFFLLFQTMYDGFVERARAVTRTLSDRRTTFVVVSTLEPSPVRETEFFVEALADRKLHLGAVVLNKALPDWFGDRDAAAAAKRLTADSAALAAVVIDGTGGRRGAGADIGAADQVARVLAEVGESFLNFQVVATREAEQRAELAAGPDVMATVPYADHDITDLAGLLELGQSLWR
jgi:anion-transporting  ArsA/GET3 family ATPase